jgi:hypothetical protein
MASLGDHLTRNLHLTGHDHRLRLGAAFHQPALHQQLIQPAFALLNRGFLIWWRIW